MLNQISAVRSTLDALGVELQTDHMEACVLGSDEERGHPAAKAMKPQVLIAEVHKIVTWFLR
jgi:CsoR family transcriptional regulator, copper-sensing transcriptional repressor